MAPEATQCRSTASSAARRLGSSAAVEALASAVANPKPGKSAVHVARVLRGVDARLDDSLREDHRFMWLAGRLAEKALIVLDLPARSGAQLVKLSFLDRNDRDHSAHYSSSERTDAGWADFRLRVIADAWPCGSFHFEAEAPDDLEVLSADITEYVAPQISAGRASSPRQKTRKGVGAGSSEAAVKRAYPKARCEAGPLGPDSRTCTIKGRYRGRASITLFAFNTRGSGAREVDVYFATRADLQ